ncbi:MAG TPA: SURF1 family protein [Acidimicrobiales bacterium]|nr:SURF1 family protein [Acidimicrobiales bacterium]
MSGHERPFWLRPKWVVGHVLIVVLVILAINLGFWQLRRLDERQVFNAEVAARTEVAPVPIGQLVDPDDGVEVGSEVRFRRATAEGVYDPEQEVLIRSRSLDDRPGHWLVTPLALDDGTAVAVNRGFVPFTSEPAIAFAAAPPPTGRVVVTGLVLASQERQGIGPTDPAEGRLDALVRVDLGRLAQQHDGSDLLPVYLQLETQDPPQEGRLPVPLPPPEQGEGSHLAYAGQWFLFAAVGAIGWPVLLRRTAQEERPRR